MHGLRAIFEQIKVFSVSDNLDQIGAKGHFWAHVGLELNFLIPGIMPKDVSALVCSLGANFDQIKAKWSPLSRRIFKSFYVFRRLNLNLKYCQWT